MRLFLLLKCVYVSKLCMYVCCDQLLTKSNEGEGEDLRKSLPVLSGKHSSLLDAQ